MHGNVETATKVHEVGMITSKNDKTVWPTDGIENLNFASWPRNENEPMGRNWVLVWSMPTRAAHMWRVFRSTLSLCF